MFIKFVVDGEVSVFEGNAVHIDFLGDRECYGVREISPRPEEGDDLNDFRIIRVERCGLDGLRLLVNTGDGRIQVYLMNDHGETIDRIYG